MASVRKRRGERRTTEAARGARRSRGGASFGARGWCALLFLLASASGTTSATEAPRRGGLVVVAPHPDDEALVASGALLGALERGEPASVIVLTNGDFDCQADGLVRQGETVTGLAALGLREENVYFLGYPDGHLAELGETPLPPVPRRIERRCERGNTTYGARGAGGADVHKARFGRSARYTAQNLEGDLRALLRELEPESLIVTHPEDTHPDHAAAYAYVRRAIGPLRVAPRLLRAFVHTDGCWPTGIQAGPSCPPGGIAPSRRTPPLSGSLDGYVASERRVVPERCQSPDPETNPKARAIFAHRSQVKDDPRSYLLSFARLDEMFFAESLVRDRAGLWATHPLTGPLSSIPLSPERPLVREHALPFALEVSTLRPPEGEPVRITFLENSRGHYEWTLDGAHRTSELVAWRRFERVARPLGRWTLPHDLWVQKRSAEFRLEVIEVAETGVLELTLFSSERLVGQAIDTAPLDRGILLTVEADPSTEVRARFEGEDG